MLDAVYEGNPPEDCRSENACVEDWGIEDQIDEYQTIDDDSILQNDHSGTAGPSSDYERVSRFPSHNCIPGIRPITLDPERSMTRRIQMMQFARAVLCQEVSYSETSRFLDQFRYIIVGSNLLQKQPLFNRWTLPADMRRRDLLFDMRKPWVHLYTAPICRVAANGGLIAFGLALHSKFRTATTKVEKSAVCAVITIVLIVYSFATSKRRLLRNLREKALTYMESFVNSSKLLDGDCVRAILDIQNVDTVCSGFTSPHAPPSASVSRQNLVGTNMSSQMGACKQLKAVISSTLLLMKETLLDAVRDVIGMCSNLPSLDQFFEIYDVINDINEMGFEITIDHVGFINDESAIEHLVGAAACYVSTKTLKQEFRKVLLLRRVLLCCLLTLESHGKTEVEELEKWTIVCDHLLESSKLMQQLGKVLSTERLKPSISSTEKVREKRKDNSGVCDKPRSETRSLVDISAAAQLLSARLGIIYDSDASDAVISEQFDAVGRELEELRTKWNLYAQNCNASHLDNQGKVSRNASSPTLIMTPICTEDEYAFSNESLAPPELVDPGCQDSSYSHQTVSFEGESKPNFPKSQLPRQTRIKYMKAERDMARDAALFLNQRNSLALELDSTLHERGNPE